MSTSEVLLMIASENTFKHKINETSSSGNILEVQEILLHSIFHIFQKKLEKFEGIPTANEFEELMKFDDMDADGRFIN